MIKFLVGIVVGAVAAIVALKYGWRQDTTPANKTETSADSERLNKQQKEREQFLKEQERQHENMMNYTGKEQR
jgi:hypothetical protein